jgi:hypothetical protein
MNKSRITRALDNLDEYITMYSRIVSESRAQPARESLEYIRFILESYMKKVDHIDDVVERVNEIHESMIRISREIDREPKYIPVSLGP